MNETTRLITCPVTWIHPGDWINHAGTEVEVVESEPTQHSHRLRIRYPDRGHICDGALYDIYISRGGTVRYYEPL